MRTDRRFAGSSIAAIGVLTLLLCLWASVSVVRGNFTFGGAPSDYEELRPKADGTTIDWGEALACDPGDEFNCFDSDTTDTTTYVATGVVNRFHAFKTLATCPDDWEHVGKDPDSVGLFVVACIRGSPQADRDLEIGRADASGFCGVTDTFAVTADGKWDTCSIIYARDSCDASAWNSWNLNEEEWAFNTLETSSKGESYRVCHAWVEAYFSSSDAMCEDDLIVFKLDTLSGSTNWESRDGCTNEDTCLFSMDCGRAVAGGLDELRLGVTSVDPLPLPLVGIDSVEIRLEGWGMGAGGDSLEISYSYDHGEGINYYGKDTIAVGVEDSTTYVEVSKVWVNNPKTDTSWLTTDFDPEYAFSFIPRSTDTLWLRCARLVIWASVQTTKSEYTVDNGYSDGNTTISGVDTATDYTNSTIYLGMISEFPWVLHRFENVQIPQGAHIDSAWYRFYSYGTRSWVLTWAFAEDADSSEAINSTDAGEIRDRIKTTAKSQFSQKTPNTWVLLDMTAAVQEVVNRTGWFSGSSLSMMDSCYSTASGIRATSYAYESGDGRYGKLSIGWTAPGQVIIIGAKDEDYFHNPRWGVPPRAWE